MIQIKTEILEEKANAGVLLRDCIVQLKQGIDLWIDEVAETLVPLLNFYQHAEPFESCFNFEEWQRRRAAVSSLSIISKNCSKVWKLDLLA
ncbi:hypothetical protein OIU85_007486 [Salix viminalis]|uniref:Uncharacterized protein n=1 Tax=Salix viminalis TaxID=40686 RepID=A0A9Q0SN18_SALVM|nr:hypothetical protein OIU85_007486 [Salix viminalis]